jgi:hypothetical protein
VNRKKFILELIIDNRVPAENVFIGVLGFGHITSLGIVARVVVNREDLLFPFSAMPRAPYSCKSPSMPCRSECFVIRRSIPVSEARHAEAGSIALNPSA